MASPDKACLQLCFHFSDLCSHVMIICKLWLFSFPEETNKKLSAAKQFKQLGGRTQASSLLCKTQPSHILHFELFQH